MGRIRETSHARRVLAWGATLAVAVTLAGCNECSTLDERICTDLGADCSVWRSDATLRGMVIPANEHRLRARESTCSALDDDAVYTTRTLPMVRNYIVHLRNPSAPQVPIPMGPPPSSSGFPMYAVMPFFVLLALAGSALYRKMVLPQAMAEQQASASAAADAQARAMAEWRAQQERANGQSPGSSGGANG